MVMLLVAILDHSVTANDEFKTNKSTFAVGVEVTLIITVIRFQTVSLRRENL